MVCTENLFCFLELSGILPIPIYSNPRLAESAKAEALDRDPLWADCIRAQLKDMNKEKMLLKWKLTGKVHERSAN